MRISRTLAFTAFRGILASMNRLWSFPQPIPMESALAVSRCLDLEPGLARVLARIGLVEERQSARVSVSRLRDLRDPLEIAGMRNAVDRIFYAGR